MNRTQRTLFFFFCRLRAFALSSPLSDIFLPPPKRFVLLFSFNLLSNINQTRRFSDSCLSLQITVREALNSALDEEMSADPKVFLMGEEVIHLHSILFYSLFPFYSFLIFFFALSLFSVCSFILLLFKCRLGNIRVHTRLVYLSCQPLDLTTRYYYVILLNFLSSFILDIQGAAREVRP